MLTVAWHFFATDAGFAAIFSAAATLAAAFLGQILRGRVNLIWFSPNSTNFTVRNAQDPNQLIQVNSGQIVIQNFGRRSAQDVQITSVPGGAPAGYALIPNVVHSTEIGPTNEWIVKIPYIAPKEVITIQILNGPPISSVRSKERSGRFVPVMHQRVFPRWVNRSIGTLLFFGIIAIFFIVGFMISYFVQN